MNYDNGLPEIYTTGISICSIPKDTAQFVNNCPTTKDEWIKAAKRKNCSAYRNSCMGNYEYHCVINTHINATIEVCAKQKIIHSGFCADFSMSAYQIFSNYMANCSTFPSNHCPMSYPSTDAYKYPGCYELTQMQKTAKDQNTSPSKTTNQPNMYHKNRAFSVQDTMCSFKTTLLTFLLLLARAS